MNVEGNICLRQPGMLFNPVIFLRMLQLILKYLFEQAEMII